MGVPSIALLLDFFSVKEAEGFLYVEEIIYHNNKVIS